MSPEPEKRSTPDWAAHERMQDFWWIGKNVHVFWPVATAAFEQQGRGALFVDTTSQAIEGKGHPLGYFPQAIVEEHNSEDITRMVREYDPAREFVIVMLKGEGHISTYRVQPVIHSGSAEDSYAFVQQSLDFAIVGVL